MSEAKVQDPNSTLPPEMYKGGFKDSAQVVAAIADKFGAQQPLTIYYPGSSSDISLMDVPGAHVIHADSSLDETALKGFKALGAEAYKADVHSWRPHDALTDKPIAVDLVTFINPTGINENEVLAHTTLRPPGLIMWYARSGRPEELQANPDLKLVGVVTLGEEEFTIQSDCLEDYFTHKSFEELDNDERQEFMSKVNAYMKGRGLKLAADSSYATIYSQMQQPANFSAAFEAGVHSFPYKKEASCFIYQKVLGEQQ